ncbi:MAG: CDP-diacylglycerol--glycerol-3-phosphate 3-phosphatidyltransferase [Candidatus Puniceispirillales bacterium]
MIKQVPNILTIFRVLASIVVPLLIFFGGEGWRLAALIIFAAASVSDWLDGMIARQLDAISTLGRMLDPIADKLLIAGCLIALMGHDGFGSLLFIPGLMILLREVFVSGLREFMAGKLVLHVTLMAKFKTTAQLIAIGLAVAIPVVPANWPMTEVTATAFWIAAIMTVWTGWDYFIKALQHDG